MKEDEIRDLWAAFPKLHPVVASSFKMRLLTAQRGLEVLSMRWRDIDGEWWTIPAEVSKNGLPHRVPLSSQALTVLERLRPITGDSEWVFASPKKEGAHLTVIRKARKRLTELSRVSFNPHDLRRTAATQVASMGFSRLVVGKILNHAERGVTAIYDRATYDKEKRQALNKWGRKLEQIVTGKRQSAKVVSIR